MILIFLITFLLTLLWYRWEKMGIDHPWKFKHLSVTYPIKMVYGNWGGGGVCLGVTNLLSHMT